MNLYLITGVFVGIFINQLMIQIVIPRNVRDYNIYNILQAKNGKPFLKFNSRQLPPIDHGGFLGNDSIQNSSKKFHYQENQTEADHLYSKVRILCWVMTMASNLKTKAQAVNNTWGKRCNVLLFMTSNESSNNAGLPIVSLNVSEGRARLIEKTMMAFQYVYQHHFHEADWFMKADDDTYVIMENLRHFLSTKNPNEPVYYGRRFRWYVPQGYHSGGAGYVLSKTALQRMAQDKGATLECRGPQPGVPEDVGLGSCLYELRVKAADAVDRQHRALFHFLDPEFTVRGTFPRWVFVMDYFGGKHGMNAMSNLSISFHYIHDCHRLEYATYNIKPFGITRRKQS